MRTIVLVAGLAYVATGPTGDATRLFDPVAGSWSVLAAGGESLPSGYLEYDPANDLLVLVYQHQVFELHVVP